MARRPQKRRKLSIASSGTSGTDTTCTISRSSPSSVPASDAFLFPAPDARDLSCVSCHRALGTNAGVSTKQSNFVVCPRCRATSCTICSRTCTMIPPSQPPTPSLCFSPSLPGTPLVLGPPEDRDRALPVPSEFHLDETPRARERDRAQRRTVSAARRRRYSDLVEDDERTVVDGEDDSSAAYARLKGVEPDSGASPGCGRVMCKNCCIENVQTGTVTCYDCYGLPSWANDRRSDSAPAAQQQQSEYPSANPSLTSLLI